MGSRPQVEGKPWGRGRGLFSEQAEEGGLAQGGATGL